MWFHMVSRHLLVDQDVVRVEVPVNDWFGQGVEVVQAARHILGNAQLLQDVHVTPMSKPLVSTETKF